MAKNQKGLKEGFRKFLVSLKRKPQTIALVVLLLAFVYYSFNLTHVSDTTAKIQGQGMGLCGFVTMLLSVLSMVCFLNAFPHRKKVNIPMLVLMFAMIGIMLFCDFYYGARVTDAITREVNPIVLNNTNTYISTVQKVLRVHEIILIASAALVALLPVYTPLLRKIKTSVEVEANEDMGNIDLTED